MTPRPIPAGLAILGVLVAAGCSITSVTVTEVPETGPVIVVDVTNASTDLREVRYEIAQAAGSSMGAASAIPCARSFTALGRASDTVEIFVDAASIGSHRVTQAEDDAEWFVVTITIAPGGSARLVSMGSAEEDPRASLEAIPGCEG